MRLGSFPRPARERDALGIARSRRVLSAAFLVAVLVGNTATASPPMCDVRLSIELTPDVPDALDAGFLSSLLSNEVSYRLTPLRANSGSVIFVELTGPGPEYSCESVIDVMRKDARVLSIHHNQEPS